MLYKIFSRSATRTTAATQAVVYNRQTKRLNLTKVLGMLLFAMPLVTANGQSQVAQPVAFDPLTVTAHQERAAEPSNASQTNTLYITEFPRYNAVWRPSDSPEIQVYGSTYEDYRKKYDELWPQGWRLYTLQSYVVNGQVLYNAVWRPSDSPEIQVYGSTYEDYRKTYDELRPQGWRLYSLDTYPTTY